MNISVICACKNRYDSLRLSLFSWLHFEQIKEIIIVDWSSDEPIDRLADLDSRIKIVRVENETHFNLAQPLNLAASLATQDYIVKFDCDYLLNPYLNFFGEFPADENSFVSGLSKVEAVEFYNEQTGSYDIDYYKMGIEAVRDYVFTYSPLFKYLKGILFVSRENYNKVGGYDESIETYGWEDTNILCRLELLGLKHKTISFDGSLIHLPHPDRKRFENSKNYNSELENYYREILEQQYSGDEVQWQLDYVITQKMIEENKKEYSEPKDSYVKKLIEWNIEDNGNGRLSAKKIKSKLENFPTVYYVSLEESIDRQRNLQDQFSQYGIKPNAILSKRFSESNDIITGAYAHTLNDGTKGCAVSHLKAIKEWYNNTNEDYGFFCEDDLSLDTVNHWNFTWKEFVENLPDNWKCVQLMCIRGEFNDLYLRDRYWDDWSVTAYIMKRDYAKRIIDAHINQNSYHLECSNPEVQPLIETILFTGGEQVYTIPLFVEETKFESTFEGNDGDVKDGQKRNHYYTRNRVLELWEKNIKSIKEIMSKLFTVKAKIPKRNMIVDYFIYFNEKELLELRIHMLRDYVDKFVIVDANRTFTGKLKPFTCKEFLKENGLWDENKIEVIELQLHSDEDVVEYTDNDRYYNHNDESKMRVGSRERIQRDGLLTILDQFDDNTVFIVSDCDEIINPLNISFLSDIARSDQNTVLKIPLCYLQGRADLRMYNSSTGNPYPWDCSMFMATKKQLLVHTPNDIRSNFNISYGISYAGEGLTRYEDLGWHFSWMGGTDRNKIKSHSYSHYDHNFDFLIYKKCSGQEMDSFIESHVAQEGSIAVSGHIDSVLKNYSLDDLPQEIFELPRVKEFLLPERSSKTLIEDLLTEYALDPENADRNFEIALWYESNGHTAPALSYFLRCAERSEDKNLAYEALIKGSYCYERQGTRDGSAKSMLEQALCLMPSRPEAYYLLARFAEKRQWWQDCYIYADQGLLYSDFDSVPLRTDVEYPGKYGLLFEKALSGWWWGKADQSKEIFIDLKKNYEMDSNFSTLVNNNLEKIGVNLSDFFNHSEIPVIGVPIVNGFHWLERLIDSIDYPVRDLVIFNNNGRGQLTEQIDDLAKKKFKFIKNIKVCHLPSNIGCSGAWNLIIKSYMLDPYWIIASHDVCFTPGYLEEMVQKAQDPEVGMVGKWDLFLLKDWVVQKVGLFDENFYPAYVEDCDYMIRMGKMNIKRAYVDAPYFHGEEGYKTTGSQTSKVEPDLHDKLHHSRILNEVDYIQYKWGPTWVVITGDVWDYQPWDYPFDNPNLPVTYTTYDLDFVRKKHLGF
jgi:hypothetical protein